MINNLKKHTPSRSVAAKKTPSTHPTPKQKPPQQIAPTNPTRTRQSPPLQKIIPHQLFTQVVWLGRAAAVGGEGLVDLRERTKQNLHYGVNLCKRKKADSCQQWKLLNRHTPPRITTERNPRTNCAVVNTSNSGVGRTVQMKNRDARMRIDSCGRAHHHNQEFGGHLGQASEKQQICIEGVTIIGFRHSGADRH